MEIIRNFGIQPILLLAQIVNFLIIILLLKKFFYGPITKALDERKMRIEESLRNADLIEQKLQETKQKTAQTLENALNEASRIISQAQQESERITNLDQEESRKTIAATLLKAQAQIEQERQKIKKELEEQTLSLVIEVVKKVLGRNLNQKERASLTSQALTEITKEAS